MAGDRRLQRIITLLVIALGLLLGWFWATEWMQGREGRAPSPRTETRNTV